MTDKINKNTLRAIERAAKKSYPEEACGLIIRTKRGFAPVVCQNVAKDPGNNFTISTSEFSAAADKGEVVAVWHTHVEISSEPSAIDIHGCNATALNWFIFSISKQDERYLLSEPRLLRPDERVSYIGRPYAYGFYDCFTIAEDYYREELSIKLTSKPEGYPEIEDWYDRGMNLLEENFEKNGFVRLVNRSLKIGDIFLLQIGGPVPNHIAIYIGDDRILHHCKGRSSTTDHYSGYWKKHTTHHLRHKDLLTL